MVGKNDDQVRCSFCNKTQNQVRKLIAGPNGAYICDECVDVCAEIIEEEFEYENGREWNPFSDINLLKPEEIKTLGAKGGGLVYCPSSNMFLAERICRSDKIHTGNPDAAGGPWMDVLFSDAWSW